ncbi:MAG TPA: hypothetical protein VGL33_25050 [Streptosporangiaceae bacterium]
MGGIGKSTLAAQIATRVSRLQSGRVVTVVNGEVSASAAWPAETDLVILDNFDDNLAQESGRWTVRDPELAARLTGWTGKLLITCRHPFSLGETPQARLTFRRLGPLTLSGAAELTTSLPAIRLLADAERDQVWRLTAGRPLAMEYLDLLLARAERYQDLASRIEAAITAGTDIRRTEPTELPDATAEQIASAAGDLMFSDLFGRLGTAARSLLIRASVFRVPVTAEALAARPGPIAECEAAGLLTIGTGHELGVHRWTSGALHRRLAEAGQGAQLAAAHRQAVAYWLSRGVPSPETGYHQLRAADLTRVAGPAPRPGPSLRRCGVALALAAVSVALAVEAGRALAAPHLASAEAPARTVPSVTAASATRDEAAAWVAGQVSGGAVLACDPAMCAALAQRGIPAREPAGPRPWLGRPAGFGRGGRDGRRPEHLRWPPGQRVCACGAGPLRHRRRPDRGAYRRTGRNSLLPPGSRHRHPGPAGSRPPAAARHADHGHAFSTGRAGCGPGRCAPADHPGRAGRERASPDRLFQRPRSG